MDGDQLESASPMDPSFWPIHPTIERLYSLKKLRGYFTDESWPSIGTSSYGEDCTGHNADDVIPLLGIFTNDHTVSHPQEAWSWLGGLGVWLTPLFCVLCGRVAVCVVVDERGAAVEDGPHE